MEIEKLFVSLALDAAKYASGLQDAQKQGASFSQRIKANLGTAVKAAAAMGVAALAGLGVAAAKVAAESLEKFKAFERGMSEVFTLLPDLSESAMDSMKQDVLEFSREAGRTTDEVIPALYQSISAGVPAENVFDFMKVASDAALGGVTDLETAVDGITSVVNAYGSEVVNAQQASDVMFTAVRLGKTDFNQLSSSLFNVIPTAASLGVGFADVAANLAAMTAQGVPTSVATTQLRQAMVEASKSGTKLDLALRDLTGKGFGDLVKEGKSTSEIFKILRNSMPEQEFKDLFGSVEASNAALLITSGTAEGIIGSFGTMEDTMGATAAAAAEMADTMEHLEARADAATESLKIQAGEGLQPAKRAYLEAKIAAADYTEANHALFRAQQAGIISEADLGNQRLKMVFSSYDAADALRWLEENTTQYASAAELASIDTQNLSYDQKFLTTTLEETVIGLETLSEELAYTNDLANQYGERAQLAADASSRVSLQYQYQQEQAALLAEAQAQLNTQVGGYFDSALAAGDQATSFEMQLYNQAVAAGAGAAELAILAANTGEFTQEQIDAAFQAALMQANIDALVASMQNGDLTARQATEALDLLKTGEAETALDAINLAKEMDATSARMDAAALSATNVKDRLEEIPTEIKTRYTFEIVGAQIPDTAAKQYAQQYYDNKAASYALGGWTGNIPMDQIAGVVHGVELVVPANVIRRGMAGVMDFAAKNVPSSAWGNRKFDLSDYEPRLNIVGAAERAGGYTDNRSTETVINLPAGADPMRTIRASRHLDKLGRGAR